MITSSELREKFLSFFEQHQHQRVPSSSLVPENDPSLLFTNAGMNQFKDVFLGNEQRPYHRATTAQRCVRAGGKHNDLENVGYTARHHTFFEMMGNFSFGDYFKPEAIRFAWTFLTEVIGLPPEKLWVTVYKDDAEAERIWKEDIGIDPNRFSRCGEKDNFWSMGDTGPCGPCSEIFYDHGPEIWGGPPGSPEEDGDRYIEIWNLVFMQFNRDADGKMTPLPKPSVDTGLGLERLAAILQGVHSNYDIDLFQNLITAAMQATGAKDREDKSLRVIADHIRSTAFLIVDGITPSNEGRGYVLRRIMRRAIRHGYRLGCNQPFFYQLVDPLIAEMGHAYPELPAARDAVIRVIRLEEERFAETLEKGMKVLEDDIQHLKEGDVISGDTLFRLYDTYGFPFDLTADIARERALGVDEAGFDALMQAQKERARASSNFTAARDIRLDTDATTSFCGYEHFESTTKVVAIFDENYQPKERLEQNETGVVLLENTPFYAESGGQVGEHGIITAEHGEFTVTDTRKLQTRNAVTVSAHFGTLKQGALAVGDTAKALINGSLRRDTMRNHSATHLLHAALRQVLGTHVQQKGSLVAPDRLRFDFTHFEPLTQTQLDEIEQIVNEHILHNTPVGIRVMPLDDARKTGAMALFGEKYGDTVRVLNMDGDFSIELCGGTHVHALGDIGLFKLISETGIAAGVRRIEAYTGHGALQWLHDQQQQLRQLSTTLKCAPIELPEKVQQLQEKNRSLEKNLEQAQQKLTLMASSDLKSQAVDVDGIKVLSADLGNADNKALRATLDQLKDRLGSAVILLASTENDKVNLIAGVTADLTKRFQAGKLVGEAATLVKGKGGGRADMAQAGGTDTSGIPAALALTTDWVKRQLQG